MLCVNVMYMYIHFQKQSHSIHNQIFTETKYIFKHIHSGQTNYCKIVIVSKTKRNKNIRIRIQIHSFNIFFCPNKPIFDPYSENYEHKRHTDMIYISFTDDHLISIKTRFIKIIQRLINTSAFTLSIEKYLRDLCCRCVCISI